MEKVFKPVSGYLMLVLSFLCLAGAIAFFASASQSENVGSFMLMGFITLVISIFLFKGIMVVNPNHSRVCIFFGKYVGTVKANGLLWVNPFYVTQKITLRSQNLE